MLILLPPSAGKTAPQSGPTLDLVSLYLPEFTQLREEIIDILQKVSASKDALKLLKAGPTIETEILSQADLYSQPCSKAQNIYTGVLYDAADFPTLTPKQAHKHYPETVGCG
ncbi:hypothetical protein R6G85_05875 [Actinotignum urinale]|uniref:peroxide stress protein YaaA n=1 Tax=Actinotignum urinale TaxID=190146 RepID=UPI002A7FB3E4|nr:peroxide stress protein YaaA [Actinotignum urinale]MDY5152004.1 hypothetical protein [Actinotignum urinale]